MNDATMSCRFYIYTINSMSPRNEITYSRLGCN